MFRLALKDFLVGRLSVLVFTVFWTIIAMGMFQTSIDIYFLIIIFGTIISSVIPMGTESRDNTEGLYISLPLRRGVIVMAKYISPAIIIIISLGWGVAMGFILNKYLPCPGRDLLQVISAGGLLLFIFAVVLAISILIPIFIKFGFISSMTLGSTISILVTGGLILGASYLISLKPGLIASLGLPGGQGMVLGLIKSNDLVYMIGKLAESFGNTISIIILMAAMAVVVFISIKISIKIYSMKEF